MHILNMLKKNDIIRETDGKPLRRFGNFLNFLIHSNMAKAKSSRPPTPPTTPPMIAPVLLEEPASPFYVKSHKLYPNLLLNITKQVLD